MQITFRTYVEPDRFRKWAKGMGLSVRDSEVRFIDGKGRSDFMLLQTGPGGSTNDPLPQRDLDDQLGALNWVNRQVQKVPGVYFTRAKVAAQQLPKLAADPLVFLADVTPNVAHNKILAAGFPEREWERAQVDITPGYPITEKERSQSGMASRSPFPQMEKLGLENFAR